MEKTPSAFDKKLAMELLPDTISLYLLLGFAFGCFVVSFTSIRFLNRHPLGSDMGEARPNHRNSI